MKHKDKAQETPATPPANTADTPAPPSPEEMEALKTQAAKAVENWNHYLRAVADLDNYRKRAARERTEAVKFANESLIEKLIPILDNFEMAATAAQGMPHDTGQSLQNGIAMIQQQFKAALAGAGVEEVDATGKTFDPNSHEAVSQVETSDHPEGHVVQQLRKGYKLRERLLRPATVIVAKQLPPPS